MTTSTSKASSRSTFHGFKNIEYELKQLQPSPQLFNYYLSRMKTLIENHDLMLDQFDRLKTHCETEFSYKKELIIRNEEVSELRCALSDIQLYLQKEREQVLSLNAENDMLRIELLKYQKKTKKLLEIAELQAEENLTPFLRSGGDNTMQVKKKQFSERTKNRSKTKSSATSEHYSGKKFPSKLKKNVEELDSEDVEERELEIIALLAHWEEEKTWLNDEITTLNQDRELKQKEWRLEVRQLQNQVSELTERLHKAETRLIEASRQAAAVGKELVSKEVFWMQERNQVASCLEGFYELLQNIPVDCLSSLSQKFTNIMEQLTQRDNMVTWYHSQCKDMEIQLEQQNNQRLEMETSYKNKLEKLMKYIEYFQGKLKEENQRRRFDMEGLLSAIKILSNRVVRVERRVLKL